MDLLIATIRRRVRNKATDLGFGSSSTLRVGSAANFARDEERMGVVVPDLLKHLYSWVGNGGFGPGYGLIGLTGGVPDDLGKTIPEAYLQRRTVSPDDPSWNWPQGLLPICHWGCAIYSCIDCASPDYRMRLFDPNAHQGEDWSDAFFDEELSFEAWISAWARGADLWDRMYGEQGLLAARHGACAEGGLSSRDYVIREPPSRRIRQPLDPASPAAAAR